MLNVQHMARTISRRWLDSLKLRCRLIVYVERAKWEAPEADPQMLFLHLLYAIKIGITIIIIIALLSPALLSHYPIFPFFYLSATTHTNIIYLYGLALCARGKLQCCILLLSLIIYQFLWFLFKTFSFLIYALKLIHFRCHLVFFFMTSSKEVFFLYSHTCVIMSCESIS